MEKETEKKEPEQPKREIVNLPPDPYMLMLALGQLRNQGRDSNDI